jgi:hypothetical protein
MPHSSPLKVPLAQNQIHSANRLHQRLEQWRLSDAALHRLHEIMPSFDDEACLLKSLAINQLYGTQVLRDCEWRTLAVQALAGMPIPSHPGANWHEALDERDRQRQEENARLDAYYGGREREAEKRREGELREAQAR